jgi:hypothetical protein
VPLTRNLVKSAFALARDPQYHGAVALSTIRR